MMKQLAEEGMLNSSSVKRITTFRVQNCVTDHNEDLITEPFERLVESIICCTF